MSVCQEDACSKKLYARDMCRMHYYRWYRAGGKQEPKLKPGPKPVPWQDRFWEKVDKQGRWRLRLGGTRCWEWTGTRSVHGYGVLGTDNRKLVHAHRLAYELLIGPIPGGMTIDHLCFNRGCVNPKHMEVVTSAENTRRGALRRWRKYRVSRRS